MRIKDAVSSPGKGTGTGDDRYGFDEAAKIAWVIDGATDVGQVRLFPDFESDAAWLAEAMSTALVTPPGPDQALRDYFAEIVAHLGERAAGEAQVPLANVPRDSWPAASFIWARVSDSRVETVRFGDCVALLRGDEETAAHVFGDVSKPDAETKRAEGFVDTSWEDKLPYLRREREAQNTPGLYIDPLAQQPIVVSRLHIDSAPRPAKAKLVLMSDGLYRLVSPFGAFDDDALLDLVLEAGLPEAVARLRDMEQGDDGPARFKASDDATGVIALLDG